MHNSKPLKLTKQTIILLAAAVVLVLALIFFWSRPVAEVEVVRRGTAISAVYGTVRIEPSFVNHVRAQNAGFIATRRAARRRPRRDREKSARKANCWRRSPTKRRRGVLKQAQADLQAATESARLDLPSSEPLKIAEGNLQRLEKLAGLSNVPAVDYEKAKSEANRLRDALKTEQIERDRNLAALAGAAQKAEAAMKNTEIRAPMDGILSGLRVIDGELVAEGNELLTVSSRKNYVRGEVNEEDVGEVSAGMKADLQMYAYRTAAIQRDGHLDSARGRSGDAALHHPPRAGKSAGKPDGRDDRRNEHHHRPPRKCAPPSDPRAARRSGAGR